MSKSFELFNQTLEIDDALYLDIQLHNTIKLCAERAKQDFLSDYHNLSNLDNVMKKGEDCAVAIFKNAASTCVEFLITLKIYNVSPDEIFQHMKNSYFAEEFEELGDWYVSLLNTEAEKDAYRTARRKNRSKWNGGGFGLNNAMAAAAQAGVLNLASGSIHGAANLVGKGFSTIGASMSKGSMYKEAADRLATAVYMDVYDWVYILERMISQSDLSIEPITMEDEQEATSLFTNLQNAHLDSTQQYNIAFQLFETNPCEREYYEHCLKQFPEQQKNLLSLAEYCLPDATDLVDSLLSTIYHSMPHKTEEDLLRVHQKLREKQTELGISQSDLTTDVENTLKKMDQEARTFKNVTFATRQERDTAEKDYATLFKLCHPVNEKTKETCSELMKTVYEESTSPAVQELFLCELENQIKCIDARDAKNKYNELYKKYSKQDKNLTKHRTYERFLHFLAWTAIIAFIGAVIALINLEFIVALLLFAIVVASIVIGVSMDSGAKKAEQAAKESAPPDLLAAWKERDRTQKEYEESQCAYQNEAKKFE